MIERRRTKGLHVADFGRGYLRFVEPSEIIELWYALSEDNAVYLPIKFR